MSSPSSNTSTNKRKADALGDPDPAVSRSGDGGRPAVIARLKDATSVSDNPSSPTTTPHIPPPVWGRVLDFMPYEEVRSALLVGKIIANEAVKYVRTLNFMKSCQLDGPSVRRFASVEEMNCLCFFSGEFGSAVLCRDTTLRLVPLLVTFAKLKRIHIGGLITENWRGQEELVHRSYFPDFCSSPANHREMAKAFYHSLLAAFKARLIPQDLDIKANIGNIGHLVRLLRLCARSDDARDDTNSEGMCATCRDVCSYFPLDEIVCNPYWCECAGHIEVVEAASKRKGSRKVFKKESDEFLSDFLSRRLSVFTIEEGALWHRLTDLGMSYDGDEDKGIWYLTMHDLSEIDRLMAFGFDPRAISEEILYEALEIGNDGRPSDAFAKSTFDALVARGFAFDEADLIVLDERMEPALKDLPALIRGETDNA